MAILIIAPSFISASGLPLAAPFLCTYHFQKKITERAFFIRIPQDTGSKGSKHLGYVF
ncbi:hypothetical protein ELI_3974 [Eubacterium callanderi]|uniref:Uncharacterized protein n=1 Tax=Eubacterium callanderi TaxID=53442 RepID=E3GGW3_9FIRM|nr:hypothetical protein ELI_3974 [Eubacterium callanderi]